MCNKYCFCLRGMPSSCAVTHHSSPTCHQSLVLFLWMKTESQVVCAPNPTYPATLSVICAFSHFPDGHTLHSVLSYHFQAWRELGCQAWPFEYADQTDMSPAGQTEKEQSEQEIKTGRVGSIVCSALFSVLLCQDWRTCWRCGMWWGFPQQWYKTHRNHRQLPKITKRRCYISHSPPWSGQQVRKLWL